MRGFTCSAFADARMQYARTIFKKQLHACLIKIFLPLLVSLVLVA